MEDLSVNPNGAVHSHLERAIFSRAAHACEYARLGILKTSLPVDGSAPGSSDWFGLG